MPKENSASISEIRNYINKPENQLMQLIKRGRVTYILKYQPKELISIRLKRRSNYISLDSLDKAMSSRLYFTLSLQRDSSEVFSRYFDGFEEVLKFVAYGLSSSIKMVNLQTMKEQSPIDYVYPRMYASSVSTTVLFCFENIDMEENRKFKISIPDFLNGTSEELSFHFEMKSIKLIPKLKLLKV